MANDTVIGLYIPADRKLPLQAYAFPMDVEARVDLMANLLQGTLCLWPVVPADIDVYCNDDGLLKNLMPNWRLPSLLSDLGFKSAVPGRLVGNCIIFGKCNEEGDSTDIPKRILKGAGVETISKP